VRAGWAFIPDTDLLSLVVGVFRMRLSRSLTETVRALPVLEEDQRLVTY
jgi:DNA primase large subunit